MLSASLNKTFLSLLCLVACLAQKKAVAKKHQLDAQTADVRRKECHTYCQMYYDDSDEGGSPGAMETDPTLQHIDWEKAKKAIEAKKLKAALRVRGCSNTQV